MWSKKILRLQLCPTSKQSSAHQASSLPPIWKRTFFRSKCNMIITPSLFLRPQYSSRVEGRAIEAQQRRGQNYKETQRKGRKNFTTVMKNKNTDIYKVSVNDCQKDKQKTYDQQGRLDICRDQWDRRSCKIFPNCVKFWGNNANSLGNYRVIYALNE